MVAVAAVSRGPVAVLQVGDMAGVGYKLHALLREHGVDARLLVCAPELRFATMGGGSCVQQLPYRGRLSNLRLALELCHQRGRFDLYHGHSLMSVLLLATNRPYVAHFHGSDVHEVACSDSALGATLRLAMRKAAHVLYCTHDLAAPIMAAGVDSAYMTWLPNPIDTERFQAGPTHVDLRKGSGFVVFHPQPVRRERRNELFFEAFIRVAASHPELRLCWVRHARSGDRHGAMEERLQTSGVMAQVRQIPRIDPADMPAYLNGADVVVDWFNRDQPAVSQTCMEALACERPVIAGIPEDPDHYLHESGVLPGGSVEEIEASLRTLLIDPDRGARLGRQGREWVARYHGYQAVHDRLWQVYRNVLGEKT